MSGVGAAGGIAQVIDLRRQIVEQNDTLRALRNGGGAAVGNTTGNDMVGGVSGTPAGGGFAETLKGAVETVNATQTKSSNIAAAYEQGQVTDVAQVMLARQEAGVAFEATLQVRNKLLSAYQDIMRMGV